MKTNILYILIFYFATHITLTQTSVYQYDDLSRISSVNYGNGIVINYSYDNIGNRMTLGITGINMPSIPLLINPPNNSVNQPLSINYTWRKSIDQNPFNNVIGNAENSEQFSILNYWFENTTDTNTFANLLRDTTLADTTKYVSGLNLITTYYWRVKAKNQIGWGNFSQWFKFSTTPNASANVNVSVIPGGFYNNSTGKLNMKDTLKVYLVDSASCQKVDSSIGVLDSVTFNIPVSFLNAESGNYYIYIYHRNHLPVSSRFEHSIIRGSTVSYDFTSDSLNTFGGNVIKLSQTLNLWGMIPGDANRDEFVDGLDQTIWGNQNGYDGYLASDFNGDYFVDGLDQTLWILFNGYSSFLPCFLSNDPVLIERYKKKINIHKNENNNKSKNPVLNK